MNMSESRGVRRVHVFVGAPVINPDSSDTRNNVIQSSRAHTGFQELPCTWQESTGQLMLKFSNNDGGVQTCASNMKSDRIDQRVDHVAEDESDPAVMGGSQELFDLQPSLQEYIDSTFPGPCDDLSLGSGTATDHHKWFTRSFTRTSQAPGTIMNSFCTDDYSQVQFPSLLTQQLSTVKSSLLDWVSPPSLVRPKKDLDSGGAICAEQRRDHLSFSPDATEFKQISSSFGQDEMTFETFGSGILCSQVVPPTPVVLTEPSGKAAQLKQHVVRKRKWEQEVKGCSKSLRGENNELATYENEKYASVILSESVKCQMEAALPFPQVPFVVKTECTKGDAREISEPLQKTMLPSIEISECEFGSRADRVKSMISEVNSKTELRRNIGGSDMPAPIVSDLGRLLQQQKRAAQLRRGDPQMRAVHTTLLAECIRGGAGGSTGHGGSTGAKRRNVLVAVLACLPVRDVQVKRGALSGHSVQVAGVVATDQSLARIKVVMWRLAAFWAILLAPGDVVVLTDVYPHMDTWMREEVLQLTPASRMLKLGPWPLVQASRWCEVVDEQKLDALLRHLSKRHQHLGVVGPRAGLAHTSNVCYRNLSSPEPDSILHCVGRVTRIVTRTEWDPYAPNGRALAGMGQQVSIARLQQSFSVECTLHLTGEAASWAGRIRSAPPRSIWAFHYMVVRKDPLATETELWSTPLSSCERLSPDDVRASFCADLAPDGPVARHSSLDSLLAAHISGRVEVTACISSLHLLGGTRCSRRGQRPAGAAAWPGSRRRSDDSPPPSLRVDATTSLVAVSTALPGLLLWGCAGCGRELHEDDRGILAPCLPCAPSATRLFYPSAELELSDGVDRVCVHVSPRVLEKLLLNIPPSWLHKPAGYGSELTFSDIVADLCLALVGGTERFRLLLASLCECDENDIVIRRSLSMLQLSLHPALESSHERLHSSPAMGSHLLQP